MAEISFEKRDFRMVSTFKTRKNNQTALNRSDLQAFVSVQVVFCMDRALESASACHRFKVLKAECLALLGRYPEAQSVAR